MECKMHPVKGRKDALTVPARVQGMPLHPLVHELGHLRN